MKTIETRGAGQTRAGAVREETKKKGTFAKVLERQGEEKPAMPPGLAALPQIAGRAEKIETAAAAAGAAPEIEALVSEIAVTLRGSGIGEVEVQFDSKTFAGLNVRITKENNRLHVRLQTESPEVAQLLTKQTDVLVRRLEARGYAAPAVSVRRRQDGRQEQRRERQK
jgi:flagellar hook-length control protein FliK